MVVASREFVANQHAYPRFVLSDLRLRTSSSSAQAGKPRQNKGEFSNSLELGKLPWLFVGSVVLTLSCPTTSLFRKDSSAKQCSNSKGKRKIFRKTSNEFAKWTLNVIVPPLEGSLNRSD
jgi:hypothetical protein